MPIRRWSLVGAALIGVAGCGNPPPGDTYFDHFIQPVLVQNCNTTSGCHKVNENTEELAKFGRAAGNLDVTSYEMISKRRDLLQNFGAYKYPGLLIKAAAPETIGGAGSGLTVDYNDMRQLDLEVLHSGNGVLDPGSDAYGLLAEWIQNGAQENGLKPPTPAQTGAGPCSDAVPTDFLPADAAAAMAEPAFGPFRDTVEPVLTTTHTCAAGNCHGAPQADFYITCGSNDTEVAFNYTQAKAFIANPVEQSQLLNVPLARDAGGIGHTGGDQFESRDDPAYSAVHDWAVTVGPPPPPATNGELVFNTFVEPIFLQRGCSFMNCHSPSATNDFKLRSGSQGFFSSLALKKNYELFKNEFMAVEFPDARFGRAVSKNILPAAGGIRHRGGPVLETPGKLVVDPTACPPWPGDDPAIPRYSPYCTIQHWLEVERADLGAQVSDFTAPQIVYVDRPGGGPGDSPTEFNNYRPNSELRLATFDANMNLTSDVSLTGAGNCGGVTNANADIRGPEVSIDGDTVAFGMRSGAGTGLQIWKLSIGSGTCTQLTTTTSGNGITIDNFDPVWSPDGQWIVFASSRGGSEGPTHSRSPGFAPQSDIWRMKADGSGAEQVTFLSNSEINPQFMREGRITMTTEKVYVDDRANQGAGVFQQLSGRRINWDRTDYHPLLAQRAKSPYADIADGDLTAAKPTVDFAQATDIRERANGDFLIILSDIGANGGGGSLAIFNRSAGTFESGRRAEDPGFLESVTYVVPPGDTNMGRLSATTAYRGTFGMHNGQILTSYATLGGTLDNANNIPWKIVAVTVDTNTGAATNNQLINRAGAQMDAVEVVKRPASLAQFFTNRRQLVFGGATDLNHMNTAYVHFPDAPMVFTLFTGNLRRGHPVDDFSAATKIEFFAEGRNTSGTANTMGIYQNLTRLGAVDLDPDDKSARVQVPAEQGVRMQLINEAGVVISMGEEHQFGPGEEISLGISRDLFDAGCGGCHGSISGYEYDIATKPDVLTGASQSNSQTKAPQTPQ